MCMMRIASGFRLCIKLHENFHTRMRSVGPPITHHDIRPHAILLDENCPLRISNFGLANLWRIEQFKYFNSRPSSLEVEENYAAHYVLEFADDVDTWARYADELRIVSYYAGKLEDATSHAKKDLFQFSESYYYRFSLH